MRPKLGKKNAENSGRMVCGEDDDYGNDVRLARRWKRRCIAYQNLKLNSCSNNARKKTLKHNHVQKEADNDYKGFSNTCLEYDDSDSHNDARSLDNDVDVWSMNDDANVDVDALSVDGDADDVDSWSVADDHHHHDHADAHYKLFFENLREDGKSYILEVVVDDEMSVLVNYEEEDMLCDGHQLETMQKEITEIARALKSGEKIGSPKVLSDISNRKKSGRPKIMRNVSERERVKRSTTLRGRLIRERKSLGLEMDEIAEPADHVARRTRGNSSKRPSLEVLHPAKRECNRKVGCNMVDESYKVFLNYVKQDGELLVFTPGCGKQVKYEEDEESLSNSEVIALDNDPYCDGNYTPFVTSKAFDSCMDVDSNGCTTTPGRSKDSQFREQLMDVFKLPYDQAEYEDLLQKVSHQSRMERHIDFRGRTKSCLLDSFGKSYLDQFSDLAAKINLVRCDRPRILNLLRGFFYWLQNLAHKGVFRPWLDSSCLEVLPPM